MVTWLKPNVKVGPKGASWFRKEPGDFVGIENQNQIKYPVGYL